MSQQGPLLQGRCTQRVDFGGGSLPSVEGMVLKQTQVRVCERAKFRRGCVSSVFFL